MFQIIIKMYTNVIKSFILICCIIVCVNSFSQEYNRANIWYFGDGAGLDFNSGQPVALYDGMLYTGSTDRGSTAMSDTNGSLLFYSHGLRIWNQNHAIMDPIFMPSSYDVISFPVPGSDHEYYVFSVPNYFPPGTYDRSYYAIVDMTLNGGLGGVSEPVKIDAAWDAGQKIAATRHKNKEDIWVIIRKIKDEQYAAFLVTQDSVHSQPVLSPAPEFIDYNVTQLSGQIKVSYDKNYLVNSYMGGIYEQDTTDIIEVCIFDNVTGEVNYLYSFQLRDASLSHRNFNTMGVEFSPDSKYLYLGAYIYNTDTGLVYQMDMQYIEDSLSFIQSKILVGMGKNFSGLQLGRDGKIYITGRHFNKSGTPYLSIIHEPWKHGIDCNFENEGIYLTPREGTGKLTNVLPDYLYRFDFNGICESDTFYFDPWFIPDPTFIEWNFGDPASGSNNMSTIPHATHVFSDGGTYEVSVYVEYPSGRIEETSREVEVEYAPEPDLGPDTTICNGDDIVLNAECGPHFYYWSTGQFGISQITVSDSGWYWVKVTSNAGCFEIDSVHIAFYAPAIADTSNLLISPTTCGGSMGVIKGLEISGTPPYSYLWTDDLGNPLSNNLDIFHLPVGNYTLHVTDGNGCVTSFGPYTIHDVGDVLIEDVEYDSEYCDQQNGSIFVTATSGLSNMLFYSIDNGASYYTNQGIFTGLAAGSYAVRVKDSSDCQDVYVNNPVIIENIPGPQISNITVTPCITGQNNGAIEIIASGYSDTLFYSNNNGISYQVNNGWFPDLSPGLYTCVVMDEYGCDTTFMVEVTEETTLRLEAIAGDDEVCPGNTAFVPLIVNNFQDVATFRANLMYNNGLLECQGYANAHAQLEDSIEAIVFPSEGRIELSWSSASVSFPGQTVMAELVFSSLNPGISQVEWDGQPGSSYFLNSLGDNIPVDYYMGNVKIYNEVSFILDPYREACEGDDISLIPQLQSSNGEVSYLWTYPGGDTSSQRIQTLNNIQIIQSGVYYLSVTDTAQCQAEATVEVMVYENPVPAFSAQDTITTEEPVEIDAGANYASYLWNTGETGQRITATYDSWYSVIIESLHGCMGEDSVYVLFFELINENIYIPNAFSPDGDGLNDEFKAIGNSENISSFHMYIYDRWGTLVFESKDIFDGWDGKYKGKLAMGGVYVYCIDYTTSCQQAQKSETLSGTVVLVR
jgi:gliding motility-associated-like protein